MILSCSHCRLEFPVKDKLASTNTGTADYVCPDCMVQNICRSENQIDENLPEEVGQRRFPRIPVFVPVRISPQKRGITVTSAMIVDASVVGVCIETKISLEVEDTVDMKMQGHKELYKAVGKVVHVTQISSEDIPHFKAGIHLLKGFV